MPILSSAVSAAPAAVPVTQFQDRAEFCAATTALTTCGFEGCDTDPDFTEYPHGLTIDGVRFTVSCRAEFPTVVLVYKHEDLECRVASQPLLHANGVETLNIALPAGVTAFSTELIIEADAPAVCAIVNGQIFALPAPRPPREASQTQCVFAGFTSTIPITHLRFLGSDFGPILRSFGFGSAKTARHPLFPQ